MQAQILAANVSCAEVMGSLLRLVTKGRTVVMEYGKKAKKPKTTWIKTIFVNCLSNSRRTSGTVR